MLDLKVEVKGRLLEDPAGAMQDIVDEFAQEFFTRVVGRTAYDTGEAMRGWTVQSNLDGINIENQVPHIVYLEYGTYKMAAQPMLRPTMEEADQILDIAIDRARL